MNYNRIILIGRLTRDPELRTTPDGIAVVRCRIAVNRPTSGEDVADFFDVVAFRQQADFMANYATKGRLVLVEGRLQSRSYTDREGVQRRAYEIVAQTVRLLDRPRETEAEAAPTQAAVGSAGASAPSRIPAVPEPEEELEPLDEFAEENFDVEGDPFEQL
ncbi:Single-stranded DNA-binding protein [bacterium HR15]|nr:Single-stranded DNA-binding protein [bacterium HR15]